jgi:methylthioribose-1-phosphate isomerase
MKVHGQEYRSIWLDPKEEGLVHLINQNRLPWSFEIADLRSPGDALEAIRSMMVRGAPLIGATGALGMYLAATTAKNQKDPEAFLNDWAYRLSTARPTAINLARSVNHVFNKIRLGQSGEVSLLAKKEAELIIEEEVDACRKIGEYGLPLIRECAEKKDGKTVNILTHCNAGWLACIDYGTALAPVYLAHDAGLPVHVWVDETRPRNQGARLTAWELGQHGIPHTVITDNAGGTLMQKGQVDMVLVGSDRTTLDGYVVNKIGTYLKALAAYDNHVPFYVAIPLSSFDLNTTTNPLLLPIEEPDPEEVRMIEGWHDGEIKQVQLFPENSPALNPAFDITPPEFVTALITEKGICMPVIEETIRLFKE